VSTLRVHKCVQVCALSVLSVHVCSGRLCEHIQGACVFTCVQHARVCHEHTQGAHVLSRGCCGCAQGVHVCLGTWCEHARYGHVCRCVLSVHKYVQVGSVSTFRVHVSSHVLSVHVCAVSIHRVHMHVWGMCCECAQGIHVFRCVLSVLSVHMCAGVCCERAQCAHVCSCVCSEHIQGAFLCSNVC